MKLGLGINLGFAINRYIEPEVWAKIVAEELGLNKTQFVADLLNPFLPEDYVKQMTARIQNSIREYGITVESLFTSAFTRVNHLFNPDERAREIWFDWFKKFIDIGACFGAKSVGSHFGIYTFDSYENNYDALMDSGVKLWQKLSYYAAEKGYECLIFEPMSVPREMGNTVKDTVELLDRVNADAAIPMKVCLDVGHAPHPDERDPYPWIEKLGALSPIVHLQQTTLNKSNHSPFTKEYNETGIIKADKVISALEKSGCRETLLIFEISHREHYDTEFRILQDLKESADYWKGALETYESCCSSCGK